MPPTSRPAGFDYSTPDPPTDRCPACNPGGMNRTGLRPVEPYGMTTTVWYAESCPLGCRHGLKMDDKEG
jgi:hypothetical protein